MGLPYEVIRAAAPFLFGGVSGRRRHRKSGNLAKSDAFKAGKKRKRHRK